MRRALLTPLFILLLTACSPVVKITLPNNSELAKHGFILAEETNSIFSPVITGWEYLDSSHVIIHTGIKKAYLISLMSDCRELGYTDKLRHTTTAGSLTVMDTILIKEFGSMHSKCPIRSIHRLQPNPSADN